jgi:ABC-type multidrug transport system ATPase subunit
VAAADAVTAPSVLRWAVLPWSFFIGENVILSHNRSSLIDYLGDEERYHMLYNGVSTVACVSLGFGYFYRLHSALPLRPVSALAIGASFVLQALGLAGLSQTLPAPLNKTILRGVSGSVAPGRVTAIMGPSGAGKTTFLNVLFGRLARTAGSLTVNGFADEMSRFGRICGFVPQDDVMLLELTVRENIAHSARVRLPREWPAADVDLLVDAVVEVLGLRACADTPAARVSGGQRKRANIGIELVTAPSALFLEEPTSGLDATASLQVCGTLRAIADLGLTVVAVVHQPRAEIFRSVSDLLLLAPGGLTVYQGPQAAVVNHFVAAGLAFAADGNVADDLLDFVAGRHSVSVPVPELERVLAPAGGSGGVGGSGVLADVLRRHVAGRAVPVALRGAEVPAYLAALWAADGDRSAGGDGGGAVTVGDATARAALTAVMAGRGASFASQTALCHARALLQQYRTPSWLALELGVCVLAGSIMGLAATAVDELYAGVLVRPYTLLSPAPLESLLPSLGLYQCMAIGVAGAPAAVRIFGEERDVFLRENAAGHSTGAYFLAKNLAALGRMALAALHFAAFFTILARPTSDFSIMFTIALGTIFGVVGLAQITSMVVARANAALLGTILALIVACLCGFGPSLKQGREWGFLIFAQDAAYSRWATELWIHSETAEARRLFLVDDVTAETFGFTLRRPGFDVAMLAVIGIVLRVIAFAGLLGIARWAKRT